MSACKISTCKLSIKFNVNGVEINKIDNKKEIFLSISFFLKDWNKY